jgi:ABC-type uncharacterized transport system substrate-binding protein
LEIIGKRMGLLVEAMLKLSTVGYLASRPFWEDPRGAAVQEAAKQAGISLSPVILSAFGEGEYQRVFRSMQQDRASAFMVSDEPENSIHRDTIVELAAKARIPAIYPFRDYVDVGGLMAYSVDLVDISRRLANLIDRILKGANPISRFTNRPNSRWSSISRPRRRSASKCQRCCSAAPMR